MSDKSTRWAFTAYEEQWNLFTGTMPELIAEWAYQTESCPQTGKKHYQGWLRTHRQVRFKQIKEVLPGVHLEVARDWNKLKNYCKKNETRDLSGAAAHETNINRPLTMAGALTEIALYEPTTEVFMAYVRAHKKPMSMKDDYWYRVNQYIGHTQNYESIGLFTNPQMLVAWMNTRQLWVDRQTDIRLEAIDTINEIVESMYAPAENIIPEYNEGEATAETTQAEEGGGLKGCNQPEGSQETN